MRSATASAGGAFELRALRPAAESAYAALVRLVQRAESERAPFVRMADRYAAFFLPTTALVAGAADERVPPPETAERADEGPTEAEPADGDAVEEPAADQPAVEAGNQRSSA